MRFVHGLRWINYKDVPKPNEKEHMEKAIEIQKEFGRKTLGLVYRSYLGEYKGLGL